MCEPMAAVQRHDLQAVERLVLCGAALEQRVARGRTPLLAAVQGNDMAIAKRLIEAGSDVNARDDIEWTPSSTPMPRPACAR